MTSSAVDARERRANFELAIMSAVALRAKTFRLKQKQSKSQLGEVQTKIATLWGTFTIAGVISFNDTRNLDKT